MMKKRKICIITGSRAEYGLLYFLMREIKYDPALQLQLVVTGMHLEEKFGATYQQILHDRFLIDAKIPMQLTSDTDSGIVRSVGLEMVGLARTYKRLQPDIVVILGDRFEMLAAATAATLFRIPVAHIHGGEVTEGAYDDAMRHAITKLSSLHFVAHPVYAHRVIQMGEDPQYVFNYGAPGLDAIRRLKLLNKQTLERELGIILGNDVALVTFHPATKEPGMAYTQIKNLIRALDRSGLRMIFTMPNADAENSHIFREIREYIRNNPKRAVAYASLGQLRYLSLMKYVGLMVGNSSSGIYEAPTFRLPVVNVGIRQKGRERTRNVIDVLDNETAILKGIHKAISVRFRKSLSGLKNPFGNGRTSPRIKNTLKSVRLEPLAKRFHDMR